MPRKYRVEAVPVTGRAHLVRSRSAARAATELCFARFKAHTTMLLSDDHQDTLRVNHILSKIVGAVHPGLSGMTREPLAWAAGLDWEAVVLQDDNTFGAGCLEGGAKIVLCTGLLGFFDTDDEIAVVLAHEVGHVIARHSSEMIVRFVRRRWFPTFLASSLFRRRELEADYIGMLLLAASGFDPHIAPRTLDKVGKMRKKHMFSDVLSFLTLSTHPSPKKRSRRLSRPKVMEEAMELYTRITGADRASNKDLVPRS